MFHITVSFWKYDGRNTCTGNWIRKWARSLTDYESWYVLNSYTQDLKLSWIAYILSLGLRLCQTIQMQYSITSIHVLNNVLGNMWQLKWWKLINGGSNFLALTTLLSKICTFFYYFRFCIENASFESGLTKKCCPDNTPHPHSRIVVVPIKETFSLLH